MTNLSDAPDTLYLPPAGLEYMHEVSDETTAYLGDLACLASPDSGKRDDVATSVGMDPTPTGTIILRGMRFTGFLGEDIESL
jgi:hypothetical protein